MIEFTVTHTDESLRALYQEWWKKVLGTQNAWAFGMLLLCLMVMFMTRSAAWYVVVPTVGAACCVSLLQTIRYQAAKSALNAFAKAGRPPLTFQLLEAHVVENSTMGRMELPWSSFAGVAKVGRHWVLHRGALQNAQFIAFPEQQLPPEALAFMQARLAAAKQT